MAAEPAAPGLASRKRMRAVLGQVARDGRLPRPQYQAARHGRERACLDAARSGQQLPWFPGHMRGPQAMNRHMPQSGCASRAAAGHCTHAPRARFHDKPNKLNIEAVDQGGSKAYLWGPHAWLGCERKAWRDAKDVNACARRGPGHAPFRESSRREPQVTPTLCLYSHAQVGTSLHGRGSGCRQRRPAHARAAGGGRRAALWAGTSGGNFRQVRQLTILRQVVIGSSE